MRGSRAGGLPSRISLVLGVVEHRWQIRECRSCSSEPPSELPRLSATSLAHDYGVAALLVIGTGRKVVVFPLLPGRVSLGEPVSPCSLRPRKIPSIAGGFTRPKGGSGLSVQMCSWAPSPDSAFCGASNEGRDTRGRLRVGGVSCVQPVASLIFAYKLLCGFGDRHAPRYVSLHFEDTPKSRGLLMDSSRRDQRIGRRARGRASLDRYRKDYGPFVAGRRLDPGSVPSAR